MTKNLNPSTDTASASASAAWMNEGFLELALSAGTIGLFEWDLVTDKVLWSPVTYLIFDVDPGGPPADYQTFRSRLHPDDLDSFERCLDAARKSRTVFDHEHRIVLTDGRVRFVHAKARFAYGSAGAPSCLSGAVVDTTQAHELRAQLARRERQFASLVENSPDILVRLSLDLSYVYVSPAAEQYIGLKPEECVGKTIHELGLPAHVSERWTQAMRQAIETGRRGSLQTRFAKIDGAECELESRLVPEFSAEGRVESLLVITTDVTQAELARRALALSEQRFRTLADAMPQLAWLAHADGFVHWYNRGWYDYTGASEQAMQGWGWQSVHDPAELPRVLDEWRRCIASGEPSELVFPLKRADGVYRSFLTRVRPVRDAAGQVLQWIGTNTDISDVKGG